MQKLVRQDKFLMNEQLQQIKRCCTLEDAPQHSNIKFCYQENAERSQYLQLGDSSYSWSYYQTHTWHANIKGPVRTAYEGGIFHLEIIIPQNYPYQPPRVTTFTKIPHPNVFNNQICLDTLRGDNGWSSDYSIQSILLQLQSFLFEQIIAKTDVKLLADIKQAVLTANNLNVLVVNMVENYPCGLNLTKMNRKALRKNETLKQLNLVDNLIGFDGAKKFGTTFSINQTLEFVDLGQQQNQKQGGLSDYKQSKMSTFGLRFNFLSEDAILNLIKQTTLKETFIMNNSINDYGLNCLKEGYDDLIQESRLERTVWIQPAIQIPKILYYFNEHQVGVILDVRNRKGQKYEHPKMKPNLFTFIEFADPKSLNKSLALSSTNQAYISNKKFQIYKAGTGNFIQKRKKGRGKETQKLLKKQNTKNKRMSLMDL